MALLNRSRLLFVSIGLQFFFLPQIRSEESLSDRFVKWISPAIRALDAEIESTVGESEGLPEPDRFNRSESLGYHSRQLNSSEDAIWIEVDLQKEQSIDQIAILPVSIEIPIFEGQAYGFPRRFTIEVLGEDRSERIVVVDKSAADFEHTDGYPFLAKLAESVRGRYVRMTSLKHSQVLSHWVCAISEVMVLQGPLNIAAGCPVAVGPRQGFQIVGWGPANLTDYQSPLGPPSVPGFSPTNGFLCKHTTSSETDKWMQVDLGRSYPIDAVRLLPSRPTDYVDLPGLGFPARFTIETSARADFRDKKTIFDSGPEEYPNPGDNPFEIRADGTEARFVRIAATGARYQGSDMYAFALGELQVYSRGTNVALNKAVSASDVFDNPRYPRWKPDALVDGYNSQNRLVELPEWLEGLEKRRALSERLVQLTAERTRKSESIVLAATAGTFAISGILAVGAIGFIASYRKAKIREAEELRRQIARDLHDDVGGDLGGILLLSEGALQHSEVSNELREDLQDIHDIAAGSSEAMRDIVWLIREERSLEDLVLRLRETAQLLLRKISYDWKVEPEAIPFGMAPLKVRRQVFFAFKEALTNVRKHANASRVQIEIEVSRQNFRLRIEDDGSGFDLSSQSKGYGLKNLSRRCEALKGRCDIASTPGEGTRIEMAFSLRP